MKKLLGVSAAVAVLVLLGGVAFAQMGWGYGPGMMGMGPGMMGPGMMGQGWQGSGSPCGGMGWYGQGQAPAAQMSPDNAKQTAQQYADQYLKGFSVDKVLPFTGMGGMTMFSVELKGPNNELRTLHVNPWGQVMPFGGPWHRG